MRPRLTAGAAILAAALLVPGLAGCGNTAGDDEERPANIQEDNRDDGDNDDDGQDDNDDGQDDD